MSREELPYETIQTRTSEQLKEFCRKRDLNVSGTKAELVARVFAAAEIGIAIKLTAQERIAATEKEKRIAATEKEKAKLLIMPNGTSDPDPLIPKNGWVKESESMTSWPPIYLSDTTMFLMSDHPRKDVDFQKRVLNECKEGKAYRLFDSGWLKEISCQKFTDYSEYCFLKPKCTHSMKISDTPHSAWICANKNNGFIVTAYCTCVAGFVLTR